jgi:hypothetical protein
MIRHPAVDTVRHALGALETGVHALHDRLTTIEARLTRIEDRMAGKWELRILLALLLAVLAAVRALG